MNRPAAGQPSITSCWLRAFCLLMLVSVLGLVAAAHAHEVAILKSADIAAYNQAVNSFKAAMAETVKLVEYDMQGDNSRGRQLARRIRASDAALVLAVGVKAALVAKLEIVDIPIIFCMVLDPAKYDLKAPNMAGVTLQVPLDRQFAIFSSVLPQRKRIGVLYDPEKMAEMVSEARHQAQTLGLEIVERQVHNEKEVPAALRVLIPQIEALWLLPDSTVLTEDSLSFLLGTALDANVPVIGFSSELVRSGALVGLSVNAEDVGRQVGLLAQQILNGQARPSSAAVYPERLRLALNLKTAKFLGIAIPPEVVSRADELY